MALSCSVFIEPLPENSIQRRISRRCFPSAFDGRFLFYGSVANFSQKICGLKCWILEKLKGEMPHSGFGRDLKKLEVKGNDKRLQHESVQETKASRQFAKTLPNNQTILSEELFVAVQSYSSSQTKSKNFGSDGSRVPSLCIAVIGATGELARTKIFPALFALYYSGFLPENVGIFGYSRKNLTNEDLRSVIASTLTCRVDHRQNCGDKMDAFLSRTFYINGGYNNREGMAKLNAQMEKTEDEFEANRIFYLSVPQEALLDVAGSLADKAQTEKGWNRIIVEKPFGSDAVSSYQLTRSLLLNFKEKQIYRIDHLLGRNLIENLTVLRFSNLVFEPLWSRAHIRNVQVILSEDWGIETRGRYFDGYGIIGDIVHSHVLQTIALFAMEPPISLDDEDVRNEKVKVLRSIRNLELGDIILGQYKASSANKVDVYLNSLTPTFFAAALYIDNARWDGVPFLIKAGMGLIKHRILVKWCSCWDWGLGV